MSTILDVLRKAQEDARGKPTRERIDPGMVPSSVLGQAPSRRRFPRWMLLPLGLVLAVGVIGGLFLTEGARVPRTRKTSGPAEEPAAPLAAAPLPEPSAAAAPVAVALVAPAPIEPVSVDPPAGTPVPRVPRAGSAAAAGAVEGRVRPPIERRVARPADAPPMGGEPVGTRRPPSYLETRSGPGGPEARLVPVERPAVAGADPRPVATPPPPPAKPVVRRAEDLPPIASDDERRPHVPTGAHAAPPGPPSAPVGPDGGELLPGESAGDAAAPARPGSAAPAVEVRRLPEGLPEVTINIVQWSPSADRRFAFVRVDGSNMVKVREGDEVGGMRVLRIHPQGIELVQNESRYLLRTN